MNLGKKACNSLSVSLLTPLGKNCHIGYIRRLEHGSAYKGGKEDEMERWSLTMSVTWYNKRVSILLHSKPMWTMWSSSILWVCHLQQGAFGIVLAGEVKSKEATLALNYLTLEATDVIFSHTLLAYTSLISPIGQMFENAWNIWCPNYLCYIWPPLGILPLLSMGYLHCILVVVAGHKYMFKRDRGIEEWMEGCLDGCMGG